MKAFMKYTLNGIGAGVGAVIANKLIELSDFEAVAVWWLMWILFQTESILGLVEKNKE